MVRKIKRVLIANRGEIALRVIRTLREMEIESVAVYSDADKDSLHRYEADFAYNLPGVTSLDTYLNIQTLLEKIRESGADAVHPGYGFLSENAEFCHEVEKMGTKFIGPPSSAMSLLGNKTRAKDLMKKTGVPTTPGSDGDLRSLEDLKAVVAKIGYPLILKASAGGGGRGMRVIKDDSMMKDAYDACKREALSYFKDDRIFAERYIERPRHIEIQVLCDEHGNGVHLFERDCTIQRRHQKLIEEAPSSFLSQKRRDEIGALAVKATLAAGYQGAATVEFICESPESAYFMEVNTRIQVEHPVTEMVTGIDLIREQIEIAQGKKLSFKQGDVIVKGWAIEARINAEDGENDFIPSAGKITSLRMPGGPFVRIDTHIYTGYEIPSHYDSMIAKIIVWAPTRTEATMRMRRALREFKVTGIKTTASFHESLLNYPEFEKSQYSTRFMEEHYEKILLHAKEQNRSALKYAAIASALCAQELAPITGIETNSRAEWLKKARSEATRNF
ncbi:MAG: acetyl/propionyl/methylcrotonyl-CoA carboxylase subunit alpha [Oligoflexales bacterium]